MTPKSRHEESLACTQVAEQGALGQRAAQRRWSLADDLRVITTAAHIATTTTTVVAFAFATATVHVTRIFGWL